MYSYYCIPEHNTQYSIIYFSDCINQKRSFLIVAPHNPICIQLICLKAFLCNNNIPSKYFIEETISYYVNGPVSSEKGCMLVKLNLVVSDLKVFPYITCNTEQNIEKLTFISLQFSY